MQVLALRVLANNKGVSLDGESLFADDHGVLHWWPEVCVSYKRITRTTFGSLARRNLASRDKHRFEITADGHSALAEIEATRSSPSP